MRLAIVMGALALAGCAASVEQVADQQAQANRDLAALIGDRVAGPPQDCIPATSIEGPTIIDSRRLAYRTAGRLYVNELTAACPSLRPLNTVVIEINGAQICRNDRFRAIEPGVSVPGPFCLLGKFTPYTKP